MEWHGVGFVGLNAKTYFCFDHLTENDKRSSKGISKRFKLTKDHYMEILDQGKVVLNSEDVEKVNNYKKPVQENRGFVYKGDKMITYCLSKEGLKYFYAKRKVLSDGLSTTYLDR